METLRLSTKGRITLPKSIRDALGWAAGTVFAVEEKADGILLRPASLFAATTLDSVAGCLRSKRKAKTIAQMNASIGREVLRQHRQSA
jgi:AbrB family looped-hinge helix DNA binding protein